jgi:plastocyanin
MRKMLIVATVALAFGLIAVSGATRGGGEGDATASVRIKGFEFQPKELTVKAGTTVTWNNDANSSHTVTADDGSFESPTLGGGATFNHKFTRPGTYRYYCAFHGGKGGEGMSGTVVVTR